MDPVVRNNTVEKFTLVCGEQRFKYTSEFPTIIFNPHNGTEHIRISIESVQDIADAFRALADELESRGVLEPQDKD